jgi:hypothetical protein
MTEFPDDDQGFMGCFPTDDEARQCYAERIHEHHQRRRLTPRERATIMTNIRRHNAVLADLLEALSCSDKRRPT